MYHVYGGGYTPRKKRTMDAERKKNKDQNNNVVDQPARIVQPQENTGVKSKRHKSLEQDVAIGIHIFIISINLFTIPIYASFRKRGQNFAKG